MTMFLFFCLLLSSVQIHFSGQTIVAELAQNHQEHVRGLQGRTKLSENEGMLFIFDSPRSLSFWMRGVKIPLSIGFFDENRALIGMEEMELVTPENGERLYQSKRPALYALEMPAGWFERHNAVRGACFEWEENP